MTGATPETIDKEITAVIEGAVARTPGVVSLSVPEQRRPEPRHHPVRPVDRHRRRRQRSPRRNRRAFARLPTDSDPPTIVKADANSDAIMRLAVTSSTMPIEDLTRLVNDQVVDRLAAVEGVADVQLSGDRDPLIRIIVDPDALAARRLTVAELVAALGNVALDAPAGQVSDANQTLLVRADASAKSADAIAAIQITPGTHVRDVADVVFGPADRTTSLRMNGKNGIGLGIIRQAKSNTLDISAGIAAAVADLRTRPAEGRHHHHHLRRRHVHPRLDPAR